MEFLLLITSGLFSWIFITLMDRVDEHWLIEWKIGAVLGYIFASLASICFIFGIYININISPFIFWMLLEWIFKNKLNYPSHVLMLLLVSLYFGHRIDLLVNNYQFVILFLFINFWISTYLKDLINKKSKKLYNMLYTTYVSKVLWNLIFFIIQWQAILIIYSLSFAYSCLFIKKYFPWKRP